ncbi:hypothetical protein LCGC14_3021240, partial [marine sediment metagenome]
ELFKEFIDACRLGWPVSKGIILKVGLPLLFLLYLVIALGILFGR